MRIPANATVIANVWGMLRNPDTYQDPSSFNPSRFTGTAEEPNPEDTAFGFGRRLVRIFRSFSTINDYFGINVAVAPA